MATTVVFNGVSYSVPAFGDTGYAQGSGNLSAYLIALANGPFPFTSTTPNPATAGAIRLAKTDAIEWRNNANNGNLPLTVNGTDQLTFNGVILQTGVPGVTSITGTANQVIASSPTGAVTLSLPQSIDTGATVTFASLGLTSLLDLNSGASAVFLENSNVHGISISAPTTVPSSYSFKWPSAQGVNDSTLVNDASGNLTWELVVDQPITGFSSTTGALSTSDTVVQAISKLDGNDGLNLPLTGGTTTGTVVFQKAPSLAFTILSTSGSITPDATLGPTFYIAVSGAVTLNGPTSGVDGQKVTFRILNDASHSVTLASGSGNFRFGTDITSYTNSVSLTDYIGVIWNAGDNLWDVVAITKGF